MNNTEFILNRLKEIGNELSKRNSALALIGLGSVGNQLDRLDQYSDLDFFVIVKAGCKSQYLNTLDWLTNVAPVGYSFFNTQDGCKLLFEDGVFCEFAVFEEAELKNAVFSAGRIVWKAQGVSEQLATPQRPISGLPQHSTEWLIGEALTNLYVGLSRDRRGEKLSAMRFIQSYAVNRVLELSSALESASPIVGDEFDIERRYEQRFPISSKEIPEMLQGYEKNPESAMAVLRFLEKHFELNKYMKQAVLALIG